MVNIFYMVLLLLVLSTSITDMKSEREILLLLKLQLIITKFLFGQWSQIIKIAIHIILESQSPIKYKR